MKKVLIILFALTPIFLMAQNTSGVIHYEEVMKMKIELSPEMKQYAHLIPTEQRVNMSLTFNESESIYEKGVEIKEAEKDPFEGSGMQVETMMIGGPGSAVVYSNLTDKKILRSEDTFGKKFLIDSDWSEIEWKMLAEQKDILGYMCMKAEAVTDSTSLTVWFTPQIPLAFGPSEFNGLPGVILAMDYTQDGADISINATKVEMKESVEIKKPSKGKKVSEGAYRKIVDDRLKEMNMMGGGENSVKEEDGNIEIRISTGSGN